MQSVDPTLVAYVEAEIIPRYLGFDKAHRPDHVRTVIRRASAWRPAAPMPTPTWFTPSPPTTIRDSSPAGSATTSYPGRSSAPTRR